MKGYFENVEVVAKLFELRDDEIVWKARTPDIFASMPKYYQNAIVKEGAEDYADDALEEAADRWNNGGKVGTRPKWYRVNKKSKNPNRYYVRFDDSMLLDDAIAEALEIDVLKVRIIANRDYTQFAESKRHTFNREKRRRKRVKEKLVLTAAQKAEQKLANRAALDKMRQDAAEISTVVVDQYCDRFTPHKERLQVQKYARLSAFNILKVGQMPQDMIVGVILASLVNPESGLKYIDVTKETENHE